MQDKKRSKSQALNEENSVEGKFKNKSKKIAKLTSLLAKILRILKFIFIGLLVATIISLVLWFFFPSIIPSFLIKYIQDDSVAIQQSINKSQIQPTTKIEKQELSTGERVSKQNSESTLPVEQQDLLKNKEEIQAEVTTMDATNLVVEANDSITFQSSSASANDLNTSQDQIASISSKLTLTENNNSGQPELQINEENETTATISQLNNQIQSLTQQIRQINSSLEKKNSDSTESISLPFETIIGYKLEIDSLKKSNLAKSREQLQQLLSLVILAKQFVQELNFGAAYQILNIRQELRLDHSTDLALTELTSKLSKFQHITKISIAQNLNRLSKEIENQKNIRFANSNTKNLSENEGIASVNTNSKSFFGNAWHYIKSKIASNFKVSPITEVESEENFITYDFIAKLSNIEIHSFENLQSELQGVLNQYQINHEIPVSSSYQKLAELSSLPYSELIDDLNDVISELELQINSANKNN